MAAMLISNVETPFTGLLADTLIPSILDSDIVVALSLLYTLLTSKIVKEATFSPLLNADLTAKMLNLVGCEYSQNYTLLTLNLIVENVILLWDKKPDISRDPTIRNISTTASAIWKQRLTSLLEMEPLTMLELYDYETSPASKINLLKCIVHPNIIIPNPAGSRSPSPQFAEAGRSIVPLDNVLYVYLLCSKLKSNSHALPETHSMPTFPPLLSLDDREMCSCSLQVLPIGAPAEKITNVYFLFDPQCILLVH
jgi:hypothetical protein